MFYTYMTSPVGQIMIAGDNNGLKYISFATGKKPVKPQLNWTKNDAFFGTDVRQLQEYFDGERKEFDLKLAPHGTEFQLKVLDELRKIPHGTTVSYGEVADRIGNPKASRAVGAATGRNPLSIVIPCHRVIGKSGDLVGFGGGLHTKDMLLSLEQKHSGEEAD